MQGLLDYEAGMPAGGGKCRYRTTKMLNQGHCKCVGLQWRIQGDFFGFSGNPLFGSIIIMLPWQPYKG